ncbi:MAG: anti-sigma factor [Elusimicrobiota bacterium]
MEHKTCRENLSAYLDGELPPGERLALESHLTGCAECGRELAELRRVSVIVKKHLMEPEPLSLKAAVFAKKREPVFSAWLKPAAVLSAAAAGLLIFLNLPKHQPSEGFSYSVGFGSADLGRPARAARAANGPQVPGSLKKELEPDRSAAAAAPAAVRGAGEKRYAAPAFARKGTLAQAKFFGAAGSVSSFSGGAAPAAVFSGEATSISASAGKAADKANRAAPAEVPDVTADGMRFSAAHWRENTVSPVNGGSVRAFDARGKLLWETRVYQVAEDPDEETDAQQVHITALALKGEKLEITDERGNRYLLDISTRKVDELPR